ncbi:MAG: ABC transporter permease [Bryobacterales bacterium]|jgi:putative ABC transport system permease protein|nr:ABC transporter permease [Bryobacterales bacterium]
MDPLELVRSSLQALRANKVRSLLTSLGMVIGNAAVILVVTVSLTGRDYILDQIRGIGSNLVYAYYEAGSRAAPEVQADFVKWADVEAVRDALGGQIVAATGIMTTYDSILINGREEDLRVIGSDDAYPAVRNLVVVAGRFLDETEVASRGKVVMLTQRLATRLYGSPGDAIGQTLRIARLQFTVIGVFRERTETFGLSELGSETALIPITVLRYFAPVERIDPLYVQVASPEEVPAVTRVLRTVLESRHRPGARYAVENLTAILEAARSIALVLTVVLVLISAIALVISGIGIMNIMLVTVTERTREIGLRMAVGASREAVRQQFLLEAMFLSLAGGLVGIAIGVAIPVTAGYFLEQLRIPISPLSVGVAFFTSCGVGLVFGYLPASRASRLNPTEALRYE